jgi:exosortase
MRTVIAFAVACATAWLYGETTKGLVVQWATNPDASYGAILAVVSLTLLWRRRHTFTSGTVRPSSLLTFLMVLTGLGLYLIGLVSADVFTVRASFVLVAGGLIWFLGGAAAAVAARAPLLFLLLAIPLPELVVTSITGPLQTVAARTAAVLLSIGGIPVYRDGNVLELPTSTLQIVEACSGLRSVVSLASVAVLLAWSSPAGPIRRALLILSAIPIAVLVNSVRLAASGVASEHWGAVATRDPWHSFAGWLTFVVSLGALWLARRLLSLAPRFDWTRPEWARV